MASWSSSGWAPFTSPGMDIVLVCRVQTCRGWGTSVPCALGLDNHRSGGLTFRTRGSFYEVILRLCSQLKSVPLPPHPPTLICETKLSCPDIFLKNLTKGFKSSPLNLFFSLSTYNFSLSKSWLQFDFKFCNSHSILTCTHSPHTQTHIYPDSCTDKHIQTHMHITKGRNSFQFS